MKNLKLIKTKTLEDRDFYIIVDQITGFQRRNDGTTLVILMATSWPIKNTPEEFERLLLSEPTSTQGEK